MDSPLLEVWHAASGSPFLPTVGKGTQFLVAFLLLLIGFTLTGAFTLNRSIVNLPLLGIPASLAFAYVPVYNNMSQPTQDASGPPLFRAVTSSTRPLYQLLKAIGFTNKIHVEITPEGLRFGADHARVMQGAAHWNKNLFASYTTNLPDSNDDDGPEPVSFQISLPAFLETLQIFGVADVAARQSRLDIDPLVRGNPRLNHQQRSGNGSDAFSLQTLHGSSTTSSNGTCILSYPSDGGPFSIILDEGGVKTTCNLTTYLPEMPEDIPFDVDDLSFKVIMQARYLLDALAEVGSISPERLTIVVSRKEPYLRFRTSGSHTGAAAPGVESTVDFKRGRDLLETFSVRAVDRAKGERRWSQTFKFDTIKAATEAMKIASKVSLRGDGQGVLSMQFMVEVEGAAGGAGGGFPGGGAGLSFLDFRFVPYATDGNEESDTEGEGDDVDMGEA
ncbi:repair protein Rad1/Rec1/Rad17-domain-containing protein [Pseudoneurospora amorphoporcata]|uniref:Repair protein Rad1/Rec1/Rad17-domain-containing protein n=1 Tax=Pseudoneurospora amorphoporcata TaxID=241081 RepID=A0AAN6SER4_9PEZI|nr:repair protein Rad1/Rec1/Rad17-domain-containing protein [Pseudoneurospora amorphoporcata]